uniref:Uncharacterized protein n=1 Tax=Arundo donax TaxID=35708 RepID=A0A0A9HKQ9_ARUDO
MISMQVHTTTPISHPYTDILQHVTIPSFRSKLLQHLEFIQYP